MEAEAEARLKDWVEAEAPSKFTASKTLVPREFFSFRIRRHGSSPIFRYNLVIFVQEDEIRVPRYLINLNGVIQKKNQEVSRVETTVTW